MLKVNLQQMAKLATRQAIMAIAIACCLALTSALPLVKAQKVQDPTGKSANSAGQDVGSAGQAAAVETTQEGDQCLRYDQIQQRFIHNGYSYAEQLIDILVNHRIRAIELDLHPSKPCGWPSPPSPFPDWEIFHHCFDYYTTVSRLSEALDMLKGFHNAQPQHEVVKVIAPEPQ